MIKIETETLVESIFPQLFELMGGDDSDCDWPAVLRILNQYPNIMKEGAGGNFRPESLSHLDSDSDVDSDSEEVEEENRGVPKQDSTKDEGPPSLLLLAVQQKAPLNIMSMLLKANPEGVQKKHRHGNSWDRKPPTHLLHIAIQDPCHQGVILAILTAFPEVASLKGEDGRFTLHRAVDLSSCQSKIDIETYHAILNANPSAIKTPDGSGRFPLHISVQHGSPNGHTLEVLKGFPDASRLKDNQGFLPIHYAANRGCSPAAIAGLLAAFPNSVQEKDDNTEKIPLHFAVGSGIRRVDDDGDSICSQLYATDSSDSDNGITLKSNNRYDSDESQDSESARESKQLVDLLDTDRDEYSIPGAEERLGLTSKDNETSHFKDIFDTILLAYPDGAKIKDIDGMQPIHFAVAASKRRTLGQHFVTSLLKVYPEAAQTPDRSLKLPLMLAAEDGASCGVIAALLDAYPEAATKFHGTDAQLPLHTFLAKLAPLETVTVLLNAYPEAIRIKDQSGDLPLNIAIGSKKSKSSPADSGVVSLLVKAYPEACFFRSGNEGLMPLHEAVKNNTPLEDIKTIIEANPGAVRALTHDEDADVVKESGVLPLHLALSERSERWEKPKGYGEMKHVERRTTQSGVVELLIELYREGCQVKETRTGMLPIHWAAKNLTPTPIVKLLLDSYPEGLQEIEKIGGNLPLHLLFSDMESSANKTQKRTLVELTTLFCEIYPDGAKVMNFKGKLSLFSVYPNSRTAHLKLLSLDGWRRQCGEIMKKAYPDGELDWEKKKEANRVYKKILSEFRPGKGDRVTDWSKLIQVLCDCPWAARETKRDGDKSESLLLHMSLQALGMLAGKGDRVSVPVERKDGINILGGSITKAWEHPRKEGLVTNGPDFERDGCYTIRFDDNTTGNRVSYVYMRLLDQDVLEERRKVLVESVATLLKIYPLATRRREDGGLSIFERGGRAGSLPLHYAARYKAPLEVINMLIDVYPEATTEKINGRDTYESGKEEGDGIIPLHLACQNGAPLSVISTLIKASPGSVLMSSDEHLFAVHMAIKFHHEYNDPLELLRVVEFLLELNPESASEVTLTDRQNVDHGDLQKQRKFATNALRIIHTTSMENSGIPVHAFPESKEEIDEKDERELLLHFACQARCPIIVIKKIIEFNVAATSAVNKKGMLPLNYVCEDTGLDEDDSCYTSKYNLALSQLLYENTTPTARDKVLHDRDDLCKHSLNVEVRQWALCLGCKYGLYQLNLPVRPVYKSKTCEVYFAIQIGEDNNGSKNDTDSSKNSSSQSVALKFVRDRKHFDAEKNARSFLPIETKYILRTSNYHEVNGGGDGNKAGAPSWESKESSGALEFCTVMPAADRSLAGAINAEYIAGQDYHMVTNVARQIAHGINELHTCGIIHGDVKPRNIVRTGTLWQLIDLDAASKIGTMLTKTHKYSSGYFPPEMARLIFNDTCTTGTADDDDDNHNEDTNNTDTDTDKNINNSKHVLASPSYDTWSFGVILYQLCTGRSLFPAVDVNSDNLLDRIDQTLLINWVGPPEDLLESSIFKDVETVSDMEREDARDLLRWCLHGNYLHRPQSMKDILNHCLLQSDRSKGHRWIPERKGFFLSHFQANAGPSVMKLKSCIEREIIPTTDIQKQIIVWLDKDETPTEAGMKAGVAQCECFVLVLTEGVFSRWFCQLEIKEALRLGKKFLLVNLTKPDAAASTFGDYLDQCGQHFSNKDKNTIFSATSVAFHDDDDYDIVSAQELLKQAGYEKLLKTKEQGQENEKEKKDQETIGNIFVIGVGGYFRPFVDQLRESLNKNIIVRTSQDDDLAGNDDALNEVLASTRNIIFYAAESSFKDTFTVDLLKQCDAKYISSAVTVRETDTRQGSMSDEAIREKASVCLNVNVMELFFGSVKDSGWIPLIPFFTDRAFRIVSLEKIHRRLSTCTIVKKDFEDEAEKEEKVQIKVGEGRTTDSPNAARRINASRT